VTRTTELPVQYLRLVKPRFSYGLPHRGHQYPPFSKSQVISTCGKRDQSRRPARAPGPRRRGPPPARSPSPPAPRRHRPGPQPPAVTAPRTGRNHPRCSTPSAAFTFSSSASWCAASSRRQAFSARSSSTSRASCRWGASSACASTSSGGASAPVSASTPAATATEHSKHPRKPGITHLGRRVAPQSPRRGTQPHPTKLPNTYSTTTAFTVLTLTARSRSSPIWVSALMSSPAHLYDPASVN
jgi:hypothetical protein